jgi:hypothetical protein
MTRDMARPPQRRGAAVRPATRVTRALLRAASALILSAGLSACGPDRPSSAESDKVQGETLDFEVVDLENSGWCSEDYDVGWIRASGAGSELETALEGSASPCWGPESGESSLPSVPEGKTGLVFYPLEPGVGWDVEPVDVSVSGDEWTANVRIADHFDPRAEYSPTLRGRLYLLMVDAPPPETVKLKVERDAEDGGEPEVAWW